MQSHYIYALLSNNMYHNSKNNLPVDWEEFKFDSSSLVPSDDFYAVPYINKPLKKLIIAFRGTNTIENFVREDGLGIAFNNVPHLFSSNALPFVETIRVQVTQHYPDFEISFTGHSLGAILAELCSAKYEKSAVTFESPGSGDMIHDMDQKKQLPPGAIDKVEKNIISYQAAISLFNRYNAYVGRRIRLYPDLSFTPFQPPTSPIDGCGSLDMPTPGIFVGYSWQQHHMAALLAQFDPEEGPLVYSVYPSLSSGLREDGYIYAFDAWINYDENPYYWDKTIETIYFPVCGRGQTLQAYKENYTKKALHRNADPHQQIGITINAPGSSHYPSLTIWGTTNGKDTLLFGKGKFKVIAYGFNTYKVTRDAQVSCDIEQMTLDSNRESSLFIGDQAVQGYALHYNNPSAFQSTLYLSNGLQVPWNRIAGETKETHRISMGGSTAMPDSNFTTDFPTIRFSNSLSGQFNILAGEAYQYDGPGWLAASSKGLLYNLTFPINEEELQDWSLYQWVIYQQTLLGEVISINQIPVKYHMTQCNEDTELNPIQVYEKEGVLHVWFVASYSTLKELKNDGALPTTYKWYTYTDILDNGRVALSCLSDFSAQFDNFESSYQCDSSYSKAGVFLMPYMEYPLKSGYKLVTHNPDTSFPRFPGSQDEMPSMIGKSDAFIFDNHNNLLFNLLSPLSQNDNHCYFPGAVLLNGDTLIVGFNFNLFAGRQGKWPTPIRALNARTILNIGPGFKSVAAAFSYSIYWETSSLAYFKPTAVATLPASESAFLLPAPETTTPSSALTTVAMQTNSVSKGLWISGRTVACVQGAGAQGIISAMSEAASQAATQAGYSDSVVKKASQAFYYSSIFCMQFYLSYYQDKSAVLLAPPTWNEAADSAARDITVLLAVNMALTVVKNILQWADEKCERRQWSQTGKILKRISNVVQYASYGYHFYKDSLVKTGVAVVTGVAAQKATQPVCQRAAASFLNRHQQSLSLRQGSNGIESQQPMHQPLLNAEERQQSYRTFSEPAVSIPKLTSAPSAKTLPDQKRQSSAFVALSIHSKTRLKQATIPVSSKPQKKKCCAIM